PFSRTSNFAPGIIHPRISLATRSNRPSELLRLSDKSIPSIFLIASISFSTSGELGLAPSIKILFASLAKKDVVYSPFFPRDPARFFLSDDNGYETLGEARSAFR